MSGKASGAKPDPMDELVPVPVPRRDAFPRCPLCKGGNRFIDERLDNDIAVLKSLQVRSAGTMLDAI